MRRNLHVSFAMVATERDAFIQEYLAGQDSHPGRLYMFLCTSVSEDNYDWVRQCLKRGAPLRRPLEDIVYAHYAGHALAYVQNFGDLGQSQRIAWLLCSRDPHSQECTLGMVLTPETLHIQKLCAAAYARADAVNTALRRYSPLKRFVARELCARIARMVWDARRDGE